MQKGQSFCFLMAVRKLDSHMQKKELEPYLMPDTNSKQIKDLSSSVNIIKLLEQKFRKKILAKLSLAMTSSEVLEKRKKVGNLDFMELKVYE